MLEFDHEEGWILKNWCFWTVMLENTLENCLDCKDIKPANPKGNELWLFIGRTNAKAEAPLLWPADAKSWLIGKDPDAGKDWRQEEKGTTEDEMLGWHYPLNGHEFEQALGVGDGQGSLVCCIPWDRKESDMTEWLSNNKVFLRGGYGGRLASQSKTPWNPPWQQLSLRLLLEDNFLTRKGIKV